MWPSLFHFRVHTHIRLLYRSRSLACSFVPDRGFTLINMYQRKSALCRLAVYGEAPNKFAPILHPSPRQSSRPPFEGPSRRENIYARPRYPSCDTNRRPPSPNESPAPPSTSYAHLFAIKDSLLGVSAPWVPSGVSRYLVCAILTDGVLPFRCCPTTNRIL